MQLFLFLQVIIIVFRRLVDIIHKSFPKFFVLLTRSMSQYFEVRMSKKAVWRTKKLFLNYYVIYITTASYR